MSKQFIWIEFFDFSLVVVTILFVAYFQWGILQEYMPNLPVRYHKLATVGVIWMMRLAVFLYVYMFCDIINIIWNKL